MTPAQLIALARVHRRVMDPRGGGRVAGDRRPGTAADLQALASMVRGAR